MWFNDDRVFIIFQRWSGSQLFTRFAISNIPTYFSSGLYFDSMLCNINFCFLSLVWILLGKIIFSRINEYSMHEAANEILHSLEQPILQQSCGCSKHNKMENQSKFEYMHTYMTGR
jgi:hypothetical protein